MHSELAKYLTSVFALRVISRSTNMNMHEAHKQYNMVNVTDVCVCVRGAKWSSVHSHTYNKHGHWTLCAVLCCVVRNATFDTNFVLNALLIP